MAEIQIDRDEFELIRDRLVDRMEARHGDVVTVVGNHEDHGRVTLQLVDGRFTVEAEETSLIRPRGTPIPQG